MQKETVTLEKALELNVLKYSQLSESGRRHFLATCENYAYTHPDRLTQQLNRALLPLLHEAEKQLQRRDLPPAPTQAETNAVILWGVKIAASFCAITSACYLFLSFIFGIGQGIRIWAVANAQAIGWGIAGLLVLAAVLALPRPKFKQEEKEPGEVPAGNQTIINVYSANGGDVTVNQK